MELMCQNSKGPEGPVCIRVFMKNKMMNIIALHLQGRHCN